MFLKKYIFIIYFYYIYFIFAKNHYCGFKVYRVFNEHGDNNDINSFLSENINNPKYILWKKSKIFADVMVAKKEQNNFEKFLNSIPNNYSILVPNVQSFINENKKVDSKGVRRISSRNYQFDDFLSNDEITGFLYNMADAFPDICEVKSFGKTYENRDMLHVIIQDSNNTNEDKKIVYFQAGLHAREWLGPPVLLYFIKEILSNYNNYKDIIGDLMIIVAPSVNPDGYVYSFEKERFWRKNRRVLPGTKCIGVDLNRNFPYHWNESGTSSNPCKDIYSGENPLSEPETQNINLLLEKYHERIKLFIDIHSYGAYLFYPYGYIKGSPENKDILHSVAESITKAITDYAGTEYIIGASSEVLYESAGGADDFAIGVYNIPLTYTMELPGESFEIPSAQILPFVKETFEGLVEACKIVRDMDFN